MTEVVYREAEAGFSTTENGTWETVLSKTGNLDQGTYLAFGLTEFSSSVGNKGVGARVVVSGDVTGGPQYINGLKPSNVPTDEDRQLYAMREIHLETGSQTIHLQLWADAPAVATASHTRLRILKH